MVLARWLHCSNMKSLLKGQNKENNGKMDPGNQVSKISDTVEPRYNEVLSITDDFLYPMASNCKIY